MPTVRSQIYSYVFKLLKVDLHNNMSKSYPWRERWKPFWMLLTDVGMSAELGNLPKLDFALTAALEAGSYTDSSAPVTKANSSALEPLTFKKVSDIIFLVP